MVTLEEIVSTLPVREERLFAFVVIFAAAVADTLFALAAAVADTLFALAAAVADIVLSIVEFATIAAESDANCVVRSVTCDFEISIFTS